MRVFHLFANCKWTGPAEPALNLALSLRTIGVVTDFACAPDAGRSINKIVETARDRGLEPVLEFHLRKHKHPLYNFQDARRLDAYLRGNRYDLVHCHLDNDHDIALGPARKHGIPIIRSSYEGIGLTADRRHRRLLSGTAFLIQPSQRALEHDAAAFGFPVPQMAVVPGAVDTLRFDPARETPDGRRRLNIPRDAFVAGIVARLQTHRHYEDLFEAFARVCAQVPDAHLVVVGRGTKQEQVGFQPVRERGLENRVHFTGYLDGEDYVGMLRSFDCGLYLVPGSDGTCRAARELMALAKPMIVTTRGMLAEIVQDGQDGIVCDGSPEALADALLKLALDRPARMEMGRTARTAAESHYSLQAQSTAVAAVYEEVVTRALAAQER